MRLKICLMLTIGWFAVAGVHAQDCPQGQVCLPQSTANKLLDTVNQLIEAKSLINKLLTERGASDAVIASATRVIEDYKQIDVINGMMILKYKDVMALYEKVIALQSAVIDKLTAQINKPRSAWQKFVQTLEKIALIAAGVTIGRGL